MRRLFIDENNCEFKPVAKSDELARPRRVASVTAVTVGVAFLLLTTASYVRSQAKPLGTYDDAEAYAVVSELIMRRWPVTNAKAKQLVITIETTDFPDPRFASKGGCLSAEGQLEAYKELIDSYRKANKTTLRLRRNFDLPLPYTLVSKATIDQILEPNGGSWDTFYAKYPDSGGVTSMSAVGFGRDRTLALVYMGHSCGIRCGFGTYYFLQKKAGKWADLDPHVMTCSWSS